MSKEVYKPIVWRCDFKGDLHNSLINYKGLVRGYLFYKKHIINGALVKYDSGPHTYTNSPFDRVNFIDSCYKLSPNIFCYWYKDTAPVDVNTARKEALLYFKAVENCK